MSLPIPQPTDQYDPSHMALTLQIIDQRLQSLERILAEGYGVTNNAAPQRTLDATAGTLADVRVVLATLLDDMRQAGRIG